MRDYVIVSVRWSEPLIHRCDFDPITVYIALDFFLHNAIICTYFNDVYKIWLFEAPATDDVLARCAP